MTPLRSLIADTLAAHREIASDPLVRCSCGEWSMPYDPFSDTDYEAEHRLHVADAILSALDGQLLPEGSETREDWGVQVEGDNYPPTNAWSESRADWLVTHAQQLGGPGTKAHKVVRSIHVGPWRPVESEETSA